MFVQTPDLEVQAFRPDDSLATQILRFPDCLRPLLQQFAASSHVQRDLLITFPALAIAAVSDQHCAKRQAEALKLLHTAGVPLKDVAAALGVPMWLRKLPAEALSATLPSGIGDGERDQAFGRVVASSIPDAFPDGDTWLRTILDARRQGGDEFAVWLARLYRAEPFRIPALPLQILAAWAFHGDREMLWGSRYDPYPWGSDLSLANAGFAAWGWILGVLSCARASSRRAQPCWSRAFQVCDVSFVPLETLFQLQEEGTAMGNCAPRYVERVICDRSRLYSVRCCGERVATLEIKPGRGGAPPRIAQLEGPEKTAVPTCIDGAVTEWLRRVQGAPFLNVPARNKLTLCTSIWELTWKPYRQHHGTSPFIEPAPPPVLVRLLCDSMRAFMQTASEDTKNFSTYYLEAQ